MEETVEGLPERRSMACVDQSVHSFGLDAFFRPPERCRHEGLARVRRHLSLLIFPIDYQVLDSRLR